MKLFKLFLPLVVAVGFTTATASAAEIRCNESYEDQLNERDYDILREFVHSKRVYNVQEKACALTISGDVRAEWRHRSERQCHNNLLGGNNVDENGVRLSRNAFNVAFNLRFDYVHDCAWAVAHLQFFNPAGVADNGRPCFRVSDECCFASHADPAGWHGSGRDCHISLKKAYLGYTLWSDCDSRLEIEIGRRQLYNIFESDIQFLSRFDGIVLKYESVWECVADWYWKVAGFVVDERSNHFAWATEIGFINICDWGLDFKYSFIDWRKNGRNRCGVRDPRGFKFLNSQFYLAWHAPEDWLCMPAYIYGAFLWNHNSPRGHLSHNCKKNLAGYVGVVFGQVIKEGDWSFEAEWQWVEALSIPDRDVSGIGRGNVLNESLTAHHRGNTNYKGWRFEAIYALTDNLIIDSILEFSSAIDKRIGGSHTYSKFQIEAIYAF